MIPGIISFFFGILFLQQFTLLPDSSWCLGLLLLLFLPFIPRRYSYPLLFISGFLWALLRAHWVLDSGLPSGLQGRDLLATGVVSSIPLSSPHRQRFEFDIETLGYREQNVKSPGRVRLNWYSKGKMKSASLKAGQRWQLWLRLKQPHGFMNPGGFDFEGWLYQHKIRATGYVHEKRGRQIASKLSDRASGYGMLSLRQFLYDKISSLTRNSEFSGILRALALGERSGISQAQWQVFRSTGTSHLVAISGLHIGLLAGLVYFLTLKLWPRVISSAGLVLAAPRAAALSSLLAATFYAALSGFAIPAQRALLMLFIVMLAQFRRQKVQSRDVMAFALLGVLLLDPVSVLSAGFWLSFSAVAIISLATTGRLPLANNWHLWGRTQWRISVALIPLLLFLFQQASLVSPLANLAAIPLISFLVVPLVLLGTLLLSVLPGIAVILYQSADTLLVILWWFLSHLSALSWSQWNLGQPGLFALILATAGFALMLAPRGWPLKNLGILMLMPLFFSRANALGLNEAKVSLLDVGQGLSAVIQTRQHALVFDTGPKFSDEFDTGAAVVLPFLQQQRISKLDMVILSHQDNDHRGGFDSVQKTLKAGRVLSSYGESASEACHAGQAWHWDGVFFEMLNPEIPHQDEKRNNNSCVLRVTAGGEAVLLTADIETRTEKRLIRARYNQLRAKYLVVPHHGSKTSSSQAFIAAVSPQYALIPVGFRNRYHMPHASVLARYELGRIKILETSSSGAIQLRLGEKNSNSEPSQYRKQQQKFWNSRH